MGPSATVAYRLSTLTLGPKHDVTFSSQLAINVSLTCPLILIVLVLTDRQSLGRPPPRPDSAVRSAAAVTLRATLRRASLSGTFLQTLPELVTVRALRKAGTLYLLVAAVHRRSPATPPGKVWVRL